MHPVRDRAGRAGAELTAHHVQRRYGSTRGNIRGASGLNGRRRESATIAAPCCRIIAHGAWPAPDVTGQSSTAWKRRMEAHRRRIGLCRCGRKPDPGRKQCERCNAQGRERKAARPIKPRPKTTIPAIELPPRPDHSRNRPYHRAAGLIRANSASRIAYSSHGSAVTA